jgi:uracil-DNA glycosylase family 4
MARLTKPPACVGCSLYEQGEGYVPGEGPLGSDIAFVAESAGKVEALTGRPLVGDAGGMFARLLNMLGWSREAHRLDNCCRCHPPNDWFDERAPWFFSAINHCKYVDETLDGRSKVVVTLGATALKRVMHLLGHKKVRIQDWHGAIVRDPTDRFWVVPTYHPSHLQRGAHNLIGAVLWDLQRAEQARDHGRPVDHSSLVVDPPVEWFAAWVDQVVAARQQDPDAYPISSDVETPDKAGGQDEGEITTEDRSFQLLRHNVACSTEEGVTVPHAEPYLSHLARLYASPGHIWMWNREYDFVRQVHAHLLLESDSVRCVDLMWLAHVLQSDLPRGLGFWAPFYSTFGPWKHLADREPARYGAIDALQTHRAGFGIITDLVREGQYPIAMRHTHDLLTKVLRPAQLIGVQVDRERLLTFKAELVDKAREQLAKIQTSVPESLQPLTPKQGLTRKPLAEVLHVKASAFTRKGTVRKGKPTSEVKQELYAKAEIVEKLVLREVFRCDRCGALEVQRRHRCAHQRDRDPAPDPPRLSLVVATVSRWYWREPFNPDSVPQVLAYIKHRGHKPGRAKKTKSEESTNRETLERLARSGDPFYAAVLNYRAVNKVKGTYVEGCERRLDDQDRLHPVPTFKPSTLRLSYVDPNITNVVADKSGPEGLAAGFRKCIVAGPGCRLLEVDYAAIEAVETGWCAGDPEYYRLAKLGVHSALVTHVLGQPYDPQASDAELRELFAKMKSEHHDVYDPAKRYVHGRSYGLTVNGMVLQFPHLFPTLQKAEKFAQIFERMAPKVASWQHATQERAGRQHYLGGNEHPFHYKHWFWSVFTYRRLTQAQYYRLLARAQKSGQPPPVAMINGQPFRVSLGEDGKRCLAFFPQSIAAAILKEAMLRLFADPRAPSYIGDCYFGQTPLRAPIHDSLLLEIPLTVWDRVVRIVCQEMRRPVVEQALPWAPGEYVRIGIAAKAGPDWQAMTPIEIPDDDNDWVPEPMEIEDEDDWSDLARVIA